MLQDVLMFIKNQLDQFLVNTFELDEGVAVLNHLMQQDGSFPEKNKNKMVLTLINLDYETNKACSNSRRRLADQSFVSINSPVLFNVNLLFTSSFEDYEESLKFLNSTIAFFQARPYFNQNNTPGMPKEIKAIYFDIENSSFFETHNLWSAMGAKYQPSIIYKIRHVTIQGGEIEGITPVVRESDIKVLPQGKVIDVNREADV